MSSRRVREGVATEEALLRSSVAQQRPPRNETVRVAAGCGFFWFQARRTDDGSGRASRRAGPRTLSTSVSRVSHPRGASITRGGERSVSLPCGDQPSLFPLHYRSVAASTDATEPPPTRGSAAGRYPPTPDGVPLDPQPAHLNTRCSLLRVAAAGRLAVRSAQVPHGSARETEDED